MTWALVPRRRNTSGYPKETAEVWEAESYQVGIFPSPRPQALAWPFLGSVAGAASLRALLACLPGYFCAAHLLYVQLQPSAESLSGTAEIFHNL